MCYAFCLLAVDGQWMQDIEDPFHTTCFTTLVVYGPYEMGV